jgi:hypothetical protein
MQVNFTSIHNRTLAFLALIHNKFLAFPQEQKDDSIQPVAKMPKSVSAAKWS